MFPSTFSFIHRDHHVKDNRLLPRGWKASSEFESDILERFMESTDPKGVGGDPDYDSLPGFKGMDRVRYEVPVPARRRSGRAHGAREPMVDTGKLRNIECATCDAERRPTNNRLAFLAAAEVARFLEIAEFGLPTRGHEPFYQPGAADDARGCPSRRHEALVLTDVMRLMLPRNPGRARRYPDVYRLDGSPFRTYTGRRVGDRAAFGVVTVWQSLG